MLSPLISLERYFMFCQLNPLHYKKILGDKVAFYLNLYLSIRVPLLS